MAMHLNDRMFETHLSTPGLSQTFALIAGDCNTTACASMQAVADVAGGRSGGGRPASSQQVQG
jgi:hypothetical protein